jgi:micrococcal nuclease
MKSACREQAKLIFLLTACLLSFFTVLASPQGHPCPVRGVSESGIVRAVYDGDTILVEFSPGEERRVRLIGVDAPEVDDAREEVAFWAQMARRFAFFHLYRKRITLTYDAERLDRHGRVLAYVHAEGNSLFNEFIIRQGFAFAFLKYPFRSDYQELFKEAQDDARSKQRALWRKGEPLPVPVSAAASHLGEFAAVMFRCARVEQRGAFLYLISDGGEFEAAIPGNRRRLFPDKKGWEGKDFRVTGFIEEFRGRTQVLLFFPRQLKRL